MASPFDLGTASYSGNSTGILGADGVVFNADGTRLFVVGTSDVIYQYDFSTGFDIATASYSGIGFRVNGIDTSPEGLALNASGTKLYIAGNTGNRIYELDLNSAVFAETAANNGQVDGSLVVSLVGETFTNTGGTLMFGSDYNMTGLPAGLTPTLSVAADGLSATLSLAGTAAANENSDDVSDLQFTFSNSAFAGNDAASVVNAIAATTGLGIDFQDNLKSAIYSAPVTVGTAALNDSFDVSPQDQGLTGMSFNTDGTRMYIVGLDGDNIYQYDLSPAYDVSTASAPDCL